MQSSKLLPLCVYQCVDGSMAFSFNPPSIQIHMISHQQLVQLHWVTMVWLIFVCTLPREYFSFPFYSSPTTTYPIMLKTAPTFCPFVDRLMAHHILTTPTQAKQIHTSTYHTYTSRCVTARQLLKFFFLFVFEEILSHSWEFIFFLWVKYGAWKKSQSYRQLSLQVSDCIYPLHGCFSFRPLCSVLDFYLS